jgi:hypothetical protein
VIQLLLKPATLQLPTTQNLLRLLLLLPTGFLPCLTIGLCWIHNHIESLQLGLIRCTLSLSVESFFHIDVLGRDWILLKHVILIEEVDSGLIAQELLLFAC